MAPGGWLPMSARVQRCLTRKDLTEPWWKNSRWKNHHGFIHSANYGEGFFQLREARLLKSRKRKPKASLEKQVQEKSPLRTRIASFDMAHNVEHDQAKKVFMEAGEIVSFDFYSTRHLAVVEYSTEEAAQDAIYRLTGFNLMGRPLKLQLLNLKIQSAGRDLPFPSKNLPVHLRMTLCVKGFDSSLDVETIRSIPKEHFECHGRLKTLVTPVNSENRSTGKAYIRFAALTGFRSALKRHGSVLGGHELCVTAWPEFPWYEEDGSKTVSQHTAEVELLPVTAGNASIPSKLSQSSCEVVHVAQKIPKWHTAWRGKRTVFIESSDD